MQRFRNSLLAVLSLAMLGYREGLWPDSGLRKRGGRGDMAMRIGKSILLGFLASLPVCGLANASLMSTITFGGSITQSTQVPASAGFVEWNLNASFTDGGIATGSFLWDALTDTIGPYSINVSGGNTTTFPPVSYTNADSTFA